MKDIKRTGGGGLRLYTGMFAVALAGMVFGELAWPSDFDDKVAARVTAAEANATVYTADHTSYAIGSVSTRDSLGDALLPFDSRLMTWETASIASFNTERPTGIIVVFR